jgi:hypothetical protein
VRAADWPDILLEQWSDEERRKPGWVQKPLACDFVAYAFARRAGATFCPSPCCSVPGVCMAGNGSKIMGSAGR